MKTKELQTILHNTGIEIPESFQLILNNLDVPFMDRIKSDPKLKEEATKLAQAIGETYLQPHPKKNK